MANMTTTGQPQAYLDSAVGNLIVRPLQAQSVALQAATTVSVNEAANSFRVPIVSADPSVAWVGEGETIPDSSARLEEDSSQFFKLGGLTNVSSELLEDSSPAVAEVVTKGLGRSLALALDKAFFTARGSNTKAPRGLGDFNGVHVISAGAKLTSLDPFVEAVYSSSEAGGAVLNSFVANPADALSLAKIKERSDSQRALLTPDPTRANPTTEAGLVIPAATIAGVPLYTTPACPKGTIWGIPRDAVVVAIRKGAEITKSDQVYFTSDVTCVRALIRVTTVCGHAQSIQKIAIG